MAAPSNGQRRRRRRPGILLSCPVSPSRDAYWAKKTLARANQGQPAPAREYEPIEVPKNTPTGFVNAFFAVVTGFALIWHIWWMAALGAFGAIRDVPRIRISRGGGVRDTRRDDCPVRSRSPRGGRAMSVAVAVHDVNEDAFVPPARPAPLRSGSWSPSASGFSC